MPSDKFEGALLLQTWATMAVDDNDELLISAVMWILVAVAFVFLVLRFYTRIRYVSVYGPDDIAYVLAVVSTLVGIDDRISKGNMITMADNDVDVFVRKILMTTSVSFIQISLWVVSQPHDGGLYFGNDQAS